jgi:hypothetical protein
MMWLLYSVRIARDRKLLLVKKLPLLSDTNREFNEALVAVLREHVFEAGQYVVREGESASEMFFVSKGRVEVLDKDGQVLTTIGTTKATGCWTKRKRDDGDGRGCRRVWVLWRGGADV